MVWSFCDIVYLLKWITFPVLMLHVCKCEMLLSNVIFVICSLFVKLCEAWLRQKSSFHGFVCFWLFQLNALSGYEHRGIKWLLDLGLSRWRWRFAISIVRLEDMVFQTWVSFEKIKSAFDSKCVKLYLLRKQLSNCVCIFQNESIVDKSFELIVAFVWCYRESERVIM